MAFGLGNYQVKVQVKLFVLSVISLCFIIFFLGGEYVFNNIMMSPPDIILGIGVVVCCWNWCISKLFGRFLQDREYDKERERRDDYELRRKIKERKAMLDVDLEHDFKRAKIIHKNDMEKMRMIRELEEESRNNKKADLEMINKMLNKIIGK